MQQQSPNFLSNNNKIHHDFFEIVGYQYPDNTVNQNTSMSIESSRIIPEMTNSTVHSSESSNSGNSHTRILAHPGLKTHLDAFDSSSTTGHSFVRSSNHWRSTNGDALAKYLMDASFPTFSLGVYYDAWAIDLRKLHMGVAFAQGAFGRLYRGSYNGEDVAIKLLEKPENDSNRSQLMEQQFVQEVIMLEALKHQNIVTFVGACRKEMVWCILTEYAKGGSVRQWLAGRRSRRVPVLTAVRRALDVARGMEYVHGLGFIHRDLKSDNLLIFGDKSIKIADFGVARIEVKTEGMTPETGTYRWMAPEMIQHHPYDHKVDVYSFGIVLWELVTGQLPFQNMTAVQAAFAVVNKGARPSIPNDCLPQLRDLMTSCWDANPNVRPSFAEVVKSLELTLQVIGEKVHKPRFRCCLAEPMTID